MVKIECAEDVDKLTSDELDKCAEEVIESKKRQAQNMDGVLGRQRENLETIAKIDGRLDRALGAGK